jgi:TorA maturation chaperone TorD
MSKQLPLFDTQLAAWVRELWDRINSEKRREILTVLASMARASLTQTVDKAKETDDECQ